MKNEILKHLHDIRVAAEAIFCFVNDKTFHDYTNDELLQSAVERKFEIVGEALNRIKRVDASVLEKIREHRNIVSFRNTLAHGYDAIEDRIVWEIIEDDLSNLREDVNWLIENQSRR